MPGASPGLTDTPGLACRMSLTTCHLCGSLRTTRLLFRARVPPSAPPGRAPRSSLMASDEAENKRASIYLFMKLTLLVCHDPAKSSKPDTHHGADSLEAVPGILRDVRAPFFQKTTVPVERKLE